MEFARPQSNERTNRNLLNRLTKFYRKSLIFFMFFFIIPAHADMTSMDQAEAVFSDIYKRGVWGRNECGEGTSGGGSKLAHGLPYVKFVNAFLNNYQIQSIVDLGCGDWVLSKAIQWGGRDYIGIDVVPDLIAKNSTLYGSSSIHFQCSNGSVDPLPKADLLICKDVLQHLSSAEIFNILSEFYKFKYVLVVNDVDMMGRTQNGDISTGDWRFLDVTAPPFNLVAQRKKFYKSEGRIKQIAIIVNFSEIK